jgi:stage V sporulation protein G
MNTEKKKTHHDTMQKFRRNYNMQITDVRVRKLFEEGPMKAIVSVTFDNELALHDVKVIHAREKYFVVMPSRKNPDGTYRDIVHPINAASRNMLESAVIDAYFEKLKEAQENPEAAMFSAVYED